MNQFDYLMSLFEAERNEELAIPMKKYMRDQFLFLGIKTPKRRELIKGFYQESGILKEPFQPDFIQSLWEKEEREYQYAALDYIGRSLKRLEKEDLTFIEKLIMTKSWWDTVDMLAPNPVGIIAKHSPIAITETIDGWANGDNIWLVRSAVLFQLKYKESTDEKLLYRYICQNADSKEFFIQKAIGWALREYSKTNPGSVQQFIADNQLSKLSFREGSKHLNKT